eukprot:3936306-Rhodomonas_salina.1
MELTPKAEANRALAEAKTLRVSRPYISSYPLAMSSPVLSQLFLWVLASAVLSIVLRACYAVSGTDGAYGAMPGGGRGGGGGEEDGSLRAQP